MGRPHDEMLAINPNLQLWQARSLMYACNGCPQAVFSRTWISRNQPEWILHTADGDVVHPVGHADEILLNFANLNYQTLWAERVAGDLEHEGWTGVNVIDADNDPDWEPCRSIHAGRPITPQVQRNYLGHALEVTRAVIKTSGFRLAAQTARPRSSTAARSTAPIRSAWAGIALLTGPAWTQLFNYFHVAFGFRAAPVVWDDQRRLTRSQRVYGLASYLLVQTTLSVYGARGPLNPLYQINLGDKDEGEPIAQGAAWTREYPSGDVAVNPSAAPAKVAFNGIRSSPCRRSRRRFWPGKRVIRSW